MRSVQIVGSLDFSRNLDFVCLLCSSKSQVLGDAVLQVTSMLSLFVCFRSAEACAESLPDVKKCWCAVD